MKTWTIWPRWVQSAAIGKAGSVFESLQVAGWDLGHLGEEAGGRALAEVDVAGGVADDEGVAVAGRALGLFGFDRELEGVAGAGAEAVGLERADHAEGLARGADGGAEVHQGLGEVPCPRRDRLLEEGAEFWL